MDPPCCPSAALLHEVKSDDHAEKMDDRVLKGKNKKHQNIESRVMQKWLAVDWEKLHFSDLVNAMVLDGKDVSKSQRQS